MHDEERSRLIDYNFMQPGHFGILPGRFELLAQSLLYCASTAGAFRSILHEKRAAEATLSFIEPSVRQRPRSRLVFASTRPGAGACGAGWGAVAQAASTAASTVARMMVRMENLLIESLSGNG